MTPLRIVALDLSLTATGIAATHDTIGQPRLACRTVTPRRRPGPNVIDHERLHETFGSISTAVGYHSTGFAWKPDVVVIEWLPQVLGTGGVTLRLAELHGAVKHWLWSKGIRYVDVRPQELKTYATGNANAHKDAVREAAGRYGSRMNIGTHDEADATILLALTLDAYGQPLTDRDGRQIHISDACSAAIGRVTWPELQTAALS